MLTNHTDIVTTGKGADDSFGGRDVLMMFSSCGHTTSSSRAAGCHPLPGPWLCASVCVRVQAPAVRASSTPRLHGITGRVQAGWLQGISAQGHLQGHQLEPRFLLRLFQLHHLPPVPFSSQQTISLGEREQRTQIRAHYQIFFHAKLNWD